MTPEAMREIRIRLDGITRGQWVNGKNGIVYGEHKPICRTYQTNECEVNCEFIAHAPADIRALLDALAERDALLVILIGVLHAYGDCSEGCTCGDGWTHDLAREALKKIDDMKEAK